MEHNYIEVKLLSIQVSEKKVYSGKIKIKIIKFSEDIPSITTFQGILKAGSEVEILVGNPKALKKYKVGDNCSVGYRQFGGMTLEGYNSTEDWHLHVD